MEFTDEPSVSSSIVRRVAPWAAALGLFSGGGYGVYRYAAPALREYGAARAAEIAAADAASANNGSVLAKANLNDLFAEGDATAKVTKVSTSTQTPAPANRYGGAYSNAYEAAAATAGDAQALPPEASEKQATDVVLTSGESASRYAAAAATEASEPTYGNRYGAPASIPPTAVPATPRSHANSEPLKLENFGDAATPASTAPPVDKANSDVNQLADARSAFGDSTTAPEAESTAAKNAAAEDSNPLRSAGRTVGSAAEGAATAAASATDLSQPLALAAAGAGAGVGAAAVVSQINDNDAAGEGEADGFPEPPLADLEADDSKPLPGTAASNSISPLSSAPNQSAYNSAATPLSTSAPASIADRQMTAPQEFKNQPSIETNPAPRENVTPTPGIVAAQGVGRPGERGLEGVQTPGITLQKLAPAEIQVGKKCTFAIRVANTGARAADGVQILDEVPLGTQLVGTAPKAIVAGTRVRWDIGTLSPGEERTVEMELLPTDEGEIGSVATVQFATHASAKARSTRPELALRLTAQPRVMAGQTHIVQVEVSNPGTGVATGVMLLESIPDGVSHEAGPALEFEVGALQPGETRRLDLMLTAEHAGVVNNVMTAKADASLEVEASCTFEVIAPALEVSIDGPQRRYLERPATYTVSVANPGSAAAQDVQLITQLPKGLQFVSANNMGEYDAATHSVYWSLAELPANEQGTVELTALPIEPGEQMLQIASRANQGLEDRAETRVIVEGLAALSFEVKSADQMIEVGGQTTYEIRVANQGSKAATNVRVTAVVPPGLRAVGASGDAKFAMQGDRVVFSPIAQLTPKSETTLRIDVQGVRAGDQRVRIEVAGDDVTEPIVKQESTRVYADE
jgi:uncharacterized repeat protein (TIGR01451 family)